MRLNFYNQYSMDYCLYNGYHNFIFPKLIYIDFSQRTSIDGILELINKYKGSVLEINQIKVNVKLPRDLKVVVALSNIAKNVTLFIKKIK